MCTKHLIIILIIITMMIITGEIFFEEGINIIITFKEKLNLIFDDILKTKKNK